MKSYLMHHGILGQKWGKRNGPPYPLKPSDRSAAEKKKQSSSNREKEIKENYKNARSKIDKLWTKQSEEWQKNRDESDNLADKEMQKRIGMDYWDAVEKAEQEDPKIPYKKSLWSVINEVDEIQYDYNKTKEKEIKEKYNKEFAKAGEEFLDDFFRDHDKITYDEMSKMVKKQYNHEHEEYYSDWSVDFIFDHIDRDIKYEVGFDKEGNLYISKK